MGAWRGHGGMTMAEFFHMGGYAAYVWSAYGVCLVVMVANAVYPVIKARDTRKRLARGYEGERNR
jgi:heme exporter protein D